MLVIPRNPAPTTIEGNTIIDPINTQAIHIGNQGPVLLLNNTVRSLNTAASGPVVQLGPNSLSSGNTFTVANPVSVGDNSVSSHDKTVAFSTLKNLAVPPFQAQSQIYTGGYMKCRPEQMPISSNPSSIKRKSIRKPTCSAFSKWKLPYFGYAACASKRSATCRGRF